MDIRPAHTADLEPLAALFDQYRVFYGQPAQRVAARHFIQNRLEQGDSVILVADQAGTLGGFTQLYPSFSSVSMKPIWILNDLFVAASHRRQGIATALMVAAARHGTATGAIRLELATQVTNQAAQALYESLGYGRDVDFYHYSLQLP
ncbi:MAG: GNAT family N-acetyltransferase [Cyanobacteria bacterium]|nr:GNAT family N-acetyltransferase [Cyanobacteriota bacterium]